MTFQAVLQNHQKSQARKDSSSKKLQAIRDAFAQKSPSATADVCIFAAGSLGRLDCGETSDLDVFVTSSGDRKIGKLEEIELFATIVDVNRTLKYPDLSNDGQFLKIFNVDQSAIDIGSAADDEANYFTTRMLLLLESNFLINEDTYASHKKKIIAFYCRDADAGVPFKPVFLLNDLLRYWRTLCLNYEQARSTPNRSWKKRNFNLKFSRLLSVFGTVLPLILIKDVTPEKIEELCSLVPMERLAQGLDALEGADALLERFAVVLDHYESFLTIKETKVFDELSVDDRAGLQVKADYVSEFIFDALNHASVPAGHRRYLVI